MQGTKAKALGMKLKLLVKKRVLQTGIIRPSTANKKINGMGDLKKKRTKVKVNTIVIIIIIPRHSSCTGDANR